MTVAASRLARWLALPVNDLRGAFEASLLPGRGPAWLLAGLALVLSWWIYVPVHELAHALGCLAAGGEVSRLEIAPRYGGALLARLFPWVVAGAGYAGRLVGFDTHGDDLVYLVTVAAPFLVTVLIGVPLLESIPRDRDRPLLGAVKLGLALPAALAPFSSLPGDYYEMGSIVISRVVTLWRPSLPLARWRSDDLLELVRARFFAGGAGTAEDAVGIAASFGLGVALSFLTYWSGACFARAALRPASA